MEEEPLRNIITGLITLDIQPTTVTFPSFQADLVANYAEEFVKVFASFFCK